MLKLIDVKKDYETAGAVVHALKGINLRFRKNEFVSILGASGCGKTTLLNIIGGLDHYTSGDLVINGKSTKTYKDHDWDVYRNHRIGFVFQSYNLIPQQTVLGNVEIALTIAGVSKAERRQRAEEALRKVGLEREMKKRPNQLSGGQMQRVAIARALVNNPEILLADEPTGALDTETSVQIMDLIREIAGERLVIMVTHNPELAEEYSSRIVRLQDGLVLSDSNPCEEEEEENEAPMSELNEENLVEAPVAAGEEGKRKKPKKERSSMSFKTSLSLSARNLAMKKGRTIITSVAGSIGIISVCLVLALSNGFNRYIAKTQEDMLSSNPLQITETTMDMAAIMSGMSTATDMPDLSQLDNSVYVNSFLTNIAQGMTVKNDLSVEYINYINAMDKDVYEAIVYDTGVEWKDSLYTEVLVGEGEGQKTVMSLSRLKEYYVAKIAAIDGSYSQLVPLVDYLGSIYGKMPGTSERAIQAGEFGDYVLSQYDVIKGRFPTAEGAGTEAVLVVGDNNDMTDLTLAQLGLMREDDFVELFEEDKMKTPEKEVSFDSIIGKKYRLNYNNYLYTPTVGSGEYLYQKAAGERADLEEGEGVTVTVTGILRVKEGVNYGCLGNGGLFFTEKLNDDALAVNAESNIAKTLRSQEEKSQAFFSVLQEMANPDNAANLATLGQQMSQIVMENQTLFRIRAEKGLDKAYMAGDSFTKDQPQLAMLLDGCYFISDASLLRTVGAKSAVNKISIYTDSFETKEAALAYLDAWNDRYVDDTAKQVKYTDTVGMMLSMVETMLNAITYVLVAFTAISLVVSSVMIGIITYVSVVERVKEIGVLRSLGARKRDIKNLFNAETFIIGLSSGVFGVAVTYLLSLGINGILGALTGLTTLASLPFSSACIMVAISIVLTLISGLIPANAAAKKDPVVALRTE